MIQLIYIVDEDTVPKQAIALSVQSFSVRIVGMEDSHRISSFVPKYLLGMSASLCMKEKRWSAMPYSFAYPDCLVKTFVGHVEHLQR